MPLFAQLLWGTLFLSLCAVVHVISLGLSTNAIIRMGDWAMQRQVNLRRMILIGASFAMVIASHTIQIWIWAETFRIMGVLEDRNSALYFVLATYTSVGYGDVVLGPGTRIFGLFAGMSGILSLGFSTAFLVSILNRVLRHEQAKKGE